MNYTKGVKLIYDDSKDLYEGTIIEIEDGVQNQVGYILPAYRTKYGKLFAAAPRMYEALKAMIEANAGCWRKHEPMAFTMARKALAEAEGK